MALNEYEKRVLSTLEDDVRRTDSRLHSALCTGRPRRSLQIFALWFMAVSGLGLIVVGNVVTQPWAAGLGWVALIAAALGNVSRGAGDPPLHSGQG
jgi:hypothetical protein